jgi:predicted MarR family transcription regulator
MQASQSAGEDRASDSVLPAAERPASQDHRYMALDQLGASLTRFEMAIVRVHEAFSFWARELQRYTSGHPLSFQEVALLHCVRLRGGSTTLAEMMIFLHRHDLAAINYSLRKLEKHGLIRRSRGANRREVAYAITDAGRAATDAYGRMRSQVLVQLCREVLGMEASTSEAAAVMERMIGMYDQAAQSILNHSLISASARLPKERLPDPPTAPSPRPAEPASAAPAKRLGPRTPRRSR